MRMIPYSKQWIDDEDINAVINVLKGSWLTQGPVVEQFEHAIAKYCGAKYAVAVVNGTAALHLACLAAGLGKEHKLWTSPNTFVASANCALYCGAGPDFVDIDPLTYNMSIDALERKLFEAETNSNLPKVLVPVHFAGQSCEMERIYYLSKKSHFTVIEDACHAIGGSYKGNKIGSCEFSDMAVFSFHPVKHITTGEGGMITTNNKEIYETLLLLRSHGIVRDPKVYKNKDMAFTRKESNLWYYEMHTMGFNYRITDFQCALGISQLNKLDSFVSRRRKIASMYNEAFKGTPNLKIPVEMEGVLSAYHLYTVQIDFIKLGITRNDLMKKLKAMNIGTQVHYIPVHLQPYYRRRFNYKKGEFYASEEYYSKALSLPLYPEMTDNDVNYVISGIKQIFGGG